MPEVMNSFKMTYYVGSMLAHGGVLRIEADRIEFAPGIIERKLGAREQIILFKEMVEVTVAGMITESLVVKTASKSHRFVGSDVNNIANLINSSMNSNGGGSTKGSNGNGGTNTVGFENRTGSGVGRPAAPATSPVGKCASCHKPVTSNYNFCPFCATVVQPSCSTCHQNVESTWKFCAYCSQEV